MAKIFITGSSDGIGQLAANQLVNEGHTVVLHARNDQRGKDALRKVPGAEKVLIADLSSFEETKKLASDVNDLGKFNAVIHNAGIYRTSNEEILNVNTIAPYILTSLIAMPKRIIYISSGLHRGGDISLKYLYKNSNKIGYSDSKLHVVLLAKAVARLYPNVYSNAVNPGWIPTKMGGSGAPDSLEEGYKTQTWLAVDEDATFSGYYFFHKEKSVYKAETDNIELQNLFLKRCEEITGIRLEKS